MLLCAIVDTEEARPDDPVGRGELQVCNSVAIDGINVSSTANYILLFADHVIRD
jgi:hypothetical protein